MQEKVEIPAVFGQDGGLMSTDFVISSAYRDLANRALFDSLLTGGSGESFTHRALGKIIELVDTDDSRVIRHALAQGPSNSELEKLTQHQYDAPSSGGLEQYSLPTDYKQQIKLSFFQMGLDLSSLQDIYARSLQNTAIPQLIKDVLLLAPEGQRANLSEIFNLIKCNLGNQEICLPAASAGDLLILTYLPYPIRQAVSDLIVTETLIRKLFSDYVEKDATLYSPFNQISDYLRSQVLCGSRWAALARTSGDQELQKEIVRNSIQGCELLKTLAGSANEAVENSPILKATHCYQQTAKELTTLVRECGYSSTCTRWQTADIGHAFHGFRDYLFDRYVRSGAPRQVGQKTGTYAAILEDDYQQQSSYRDLIERYSCYRLLPESQSLGSSPNDLIPVIDNIGVHLFLLDIQNDENRRAGIDLAEMIIRKRITWSNTSESGKARHTKIILWSYSESAITEARIHLGTVADEIDPTKEAIDGIAQRGEWSDSPIRISIDHKCSDWELLDRL